MEGHQFCPQYVAAPKSWQGIHGVYHKLTHWEGENVVNYHVALKKNLMI